MNLSVVDCGADPTGRHCSTEAIQSCIDRAASTGKTVLFPKGRYLSGGLVLRSGSTLQFLAGSELLGVPDVNQYAQRTVWRDSRHPLPHRALLLGENVEGITLLGPGSIDGQGGLFPGDGQSNDKYLRPMVIHIRHGRRIRVENLHLRNSAIWMQSYEQCRDLVIRGMTVDNVCSHCNDGLDIVSCKDVIVSDCHLHADDDGLCFKTFEDVPCENISVSNCHISSHCNAIKIGTDSYGDFRHINVSNCTVTPLENTRTFWGNRDGLSGILICSMDGAVVEDVCFSRVAIQGTRAPIFMRLGDRGRACSPSSQRKPPGKIRAIRFTEVEVKNGGTMGIELTAVPGTIIEEVEFDGCQFEFVGGGPEEPEWAAPYPVPEVDGAMYPNPGIHGFPPSWAMFLRRVDGLTLNRVCFSHLAPERRFAIVADAVDHLQLEKVLFPQDTPPPVEWVPRGSESPRIVFNPSINPRLLARYRV